jgi:hypothetical protein
MSTTPAEEATVHVISDSQNQVSFTVDASKPVTVRIELGTGCQCSADHGRAGSYVDSDLGR